MENKTVVERAGGWYTEGQRADQWELIMDGQLRIEYLIWQERTKTTLYQGHLLHQGKRFPFCVDKATLDKRGFEYLQELLMPHRQFLTCAPRWQNRLVNIAQQFHTPKIVEGAEVVGWDTERVAFVLPRCRIELGGELRSNRGVFPPGSPGERFGDVEPLSGQELHRLLPTGPLGGMLWGSAVSLLANILAPAFNQHTVGIASVGGTMTDILRAVAEDFGCLSHQISSGEGAPDKLRSAEAAHRWPVWVDAPARSKAARQFADETRGPDKHNCGLAMSWYVAVAQNLQGGWCVLESGEPHRLTIEMRGALRGLVPAYLLDLAKRRLQLHSIPANGNWWDTVAADLESYVKRFGEDPAAVAAARDVYRSPEDPDALADLTSQLVRDRKWAMVPDGFADDKLPSLLRIGEEVFGEAAVAVPKEALLQWAAKQGVTLDPNKVGSVLARADLLKEDRDDYWVVPEDWWMERMRLTQNERTGLLRVRA